MEERKRVLRRIVDRCVDFRNCVSNGAAMPPVEIFRGRNTDLASQNAYIDRLESRLNHMPLEERVTLALAYQMGFSIDEISAITQVAPATVNVRMFQARTRLRDKT
jgi:DNA-directed RNA polymerase specialized sigma24 family protein